MSAFERPRTTEATRAAPEREDLPERSRVWREAVRDLLSEAVAEWLRAGGKLHAPCPAEPAAAASWWLERQEPRIVRSTGYQSPSEYAVLCAQALRNWLRLGDAERRMVLAGIADGIPYRGESWAIYREIADQAMEQRQHPGKYRDGAQAMLDRLLPALRRSRIRRAGSDEAGIVVSRAEVQDAPVEPWERLPKGRERAEAALRADAGRAR